MAEYKEIIVLDFDRTIHTYESGWTEADDIPDGIIDGAIEAILKYLKEFRVAILSARSGQYNAIPAMQAWLKKHLISWLNDTPTSMKAVSSMYELAEYYPEGNNDDFEKGIWADSIISKLEFPITKPPAKLLIDDAGYRFEGKYPSVKEIKEMKSWNE